MGRVQMSTKVPLLRCLRWEIFWHITFCNEASIRARILSSH